MKLLGEIKDYLLNLTRSYEQNPYGPHIIREQSPSGIQRQAGVYLLPPVILWDPLLQFPRIFSGNLYCNHHSHAHHCVPLIPKRWKCGTSDKDLPRKLYGNDCIVLLVSRVYVCCEGHEVLAHDPFIVDNIPQDNVPFSLSHKSGVTLELSRSIISLANAGLTFTEIERHVAQEYYNWFWIRESKFQEANISFREQNPNEPVNNTAQIFPDCKEWVELPSDDIIIGCFILHFEENEFLYTKKMCEFSAVYLSADHTFKVAANIGVRLPNKWVKQYDSLFCVVNEKGQVLAWQLTKGTSIDNVSKLLQNLKKRLDMQNATLDAIYDAIYVDNCCQVKKKLTKIFGADVPVKLDLFHAIARVTQKLPRQARHFMTHSCMMDFVNVFREDDDKDKERKQATPSIDKLTENMKVFIDKWKDVQLGDQENVLTSAVLHETQCLMNHIKNGCLSGIPVGAGSEKNEIMHRNLRHIIPRSRLGVKSSLALLTCFFYQWNERKEGNFPKGVVPPISHYAVIQDNSPVQEKFGLTSNVGEIDGDFSTFLAGKTDVFQMHSAIQHEDVNKGGLKQVLSKGLNYLLVEKELSALSDSRSLNTRLIHLMPCAVTLFSNQQHGMVKDSDQSLRTLQQIISEHGLQLCEQPQDLEKEESFFFSILSGLQYLLTQLMSASKEEYDVVMTKCASLAIDTDSITIDGIKQLRSRISEEWEQNPTMYRKLLVSEEFNFSDEACNFKKIGHFTGDLGNLLAIAAARVLQVCVVIFTSLDHIPIVPVVPVDAALSSRCILLGYDVASGLYYHVKSKNLESNAVVNEKPASQTSKHYDESKGCSCGRGAAKKDLDRQFCKQVLGGIPSRCICYVNMKGCSHRCHCNQCGNPYGTSQSAKAVYPQSRVRKAHKLKGQKSKSDANFMIAHGIQPLLGWNGIQSMMFDCLVDYMLSENEDVNSHSCLAKYNDLRQLAAEEGIHCLVPRGLREVQGKLTHVIKCANIFENLFKKQIELNWFK